MRQIFLTFLCLVAFISVKAQNTTYLHSDQWGPVGANNISGTITAVLTPDTDNGSLSIDFSFSDITGDGANLNDPVMVYIYTPGEISATKRKQLSGSFSFIANGFTTGQDITVSIRWALPAGQLDYRIPYRFGETNSSATIAFPPDFTLDFGEPTLTPTSWAIPYSIVTDPSDTDLTGYRFDLWLEYIGGNSYTHSYTTEGTFVQEGLHQDQTYTVYPKGIITTPEGNTYHITNQDKTFTIKTPVDENAVTFTVDYTNRQRTDDGKFTCDYAFVPSKADADLTGYRFRTWLDFDGIAQDGDNSWTEGQTGMLTVAGLDNSKSYNAYPKIQIMEPGETNWTDIAYPGTSFTVEKNGSDPVTPPDPEIKKTASVEYIADSQSFSKNPEGTPNSAILRFKIKFHNPDKSPVKSIRLAACNNAGHINGSEYNADNYEKWPNGDLIFGSCTIENPAEGDNEASMIVGQLPANFVGYMKSEITYSDGSTMESGGFSTFNCNINDLKDYDGDYLKLEPVNISRFSGMFSIKIDMPLANENTDTRMYLAIAPEGVAEDDLIWVPQHEYKIKNGSYYYAYNHLDSDTRYAAKAVSSQKVESQIVSREQVVYFHTTVEPNGTYIWQQNGYFQDGVHPEIGLNGAIHPGSVWNTITYKAETNELFITHETTVYNDVVLEQMVSKVRVLATDKDGKEWDFYLYKDQSFFGHTTFKVIHDGFDPRNFDKIKFSYMTDYISGGQAHFEDLEYTLGQTSENRAITAPHHIEWLEFPTETKGKNQTTLSKDEHTTQLVAVVVDEDGDYLLDLPVSFAIDETSATHADKGAAIDHDTLWYLNLSEYNEPDAKFQDLKINAIYRQAEPRDVSRADGDMSGNILTASKLFAYNDTPTSITTVDTDIDTPATYYSLNGIRIDNPAPGSIVIMVKGSKASKIIVR